MLLKTIFDRVSSFICLVLLSPILLAIAIIITTKMPDGPAIFKQKRIGKNGMPFTMYKFRSMSIQHHGNTVTVSGEKRITSLGSILRKHKLDELPELWNILRGEMSFVGPRPDVPGYADQLLGNDRKVLLLRPGLTGPSSLKYRNEEKLLALQKNPQQYNDEVIYPDKVRINLNYLEHWSIKLDLKIILYTILGKDLKESYFK